MGVQEMALMLLGIGIVSEQFGGGQGLISLGTGVQKLVAAPLMGTGTGLSSLAGGLKDLASVFGDIGRGLAELFAAIPTGPLTGIPFAPISGNGNGALPAPPTNGLPPIIAMLAPPVTTDSGGSDATLLAGGGGNVPTNSFFSLAEPSAYVKARYAVSPGRAGGMAGWYVSISPIMDDGAGGTVML